MKPFLLALILFTLRAGAMEAKGVFGLASRESALVVNNLLLAFVTLRRGLEPQAFVFAASAPSGQEMV